MPLRPNATRPATPIPKSPPPRNRDTDESHTANGARSHTFASEVATATKDPALVKELLGHASVASTDVYLHARWNDLRAAVDGHARTVEDPR